jgi:hypothetical protein
MTRAEEIAASRQLLATVQAFRESVATDTEGDQKTRILQHADTLIAKVQMHLVALEHPAAATSADLLQSGALQ